MQEELADGVPGWATASEGHLSLNNGEHGFWRMFGLQTQGSANGLKELVGHMVSVASLFIVLKAAVDNM